MSYPGYNVYLASIVHSIIQLNSLASMNIIKNTENEIEILDKAQCPKPAYRHICPIWGFLLFFSFLLLAVNVKMLTVLVVCLLHPRSSSSMDTDGKPWKVNEKVWHDGLACQSASSLPKSACSRLCTRTRSSCRAAGTGTTWRTCCPGAPLKV